VGKTAVAGSSCSAVFSVSGAFLAACRAALPGALDLATVREEGTPPNSSLRRMSTPMARHRAETTLTAIEM